MDSSVKPDARATHVEVTRDTLVVTLADGRKLLVPLTWFPRLHGAQARERNQFELFGDGHGIHWPLIDEDLSVDGLLRGTPSPEAGIGRSARS